MKTKILLCLIVCLIIMTGCTLHFKATDVELESHGNRTYELRSLTMLQPDRLPSD